MNNWRDRPPKRIGITRYTSSIFELVTENEWSNHLDAGGTSGNARIAHVLYYSVHANWVHTSWMWSLGTHYDLEFRLAGQYPFIGRIMQQILNRVECAIASYSYELGEATFAFGMIHLYAIEWWVALLLVPSLFELDSRFLVQYNSVRIG